MKIIFSEKNGPFSSAHTFTYQFNNTSPEDGKVTGNVNNNNIMNCPSKLKKTCDTKAFKDWKVKSIFSLLILQCISLWSLICSIVKAWVVLLKETFLPIDYPNSVSDDYLNYQLWDTIQDVTTCFSRALSTSAVLKASLIKSNVDYDYDGGIGSIDSTAALGLVSIIVLRETCMKLGPIICFGLTKCTTFGSHNKKWRLVADVLNDIVTFLEMITPCLATNWIIPICCFASLLDGIVGILATSTRASILSHLSKYNNSNLSDIVAKEKYQRNIVRVFSSLIVFVWFPKLFTSQTTIFTTYFVLVGLHLYANYRGAKCLQLTTLNESRLLICLQHYMKLGTVPTVHYVSQVESVFFGFGVKDVDVCGGYQIKVGVSIRSVLSSKLVMISETEFFEKYQDKSYMIIPTHSQKIMNIVLYENIHKYSKQLFEAYVRAVFTSAEMDNNNDFHLHPMDTLITHKFLKFQSALENMGFSIDDVNLSSDIWRCSFVKTNLNE